MGGCGVTCVSIPLGITDVTLQDDDQRRLQAAVRENGAVVCTTGNPPGCAFLARQPGPAYAEVLGMRGGGKLDRVVRLYV